MEIEVGLWQAGSADGVHWQRYRPPVRFERLGEQRPCFVVYRCGAVEITSHRVDADHDGRVVVVEPKIVADFRANLATYPVFVPVTGEEYLDLVETAVDRQIPHHCFENGIGFVSTSQAVLAKMISRS